MLAGAALGVLVAAPARAAEPADDQSFYLEAQSLVGKDGRYVASGEVIIRRGDRILRAGAVDYDSNTKVVEASGDVQVYQPDGTAAFADRVIYNTDLTQGVANGFSARLPQNGKLAAANAVVASDTRTEMNRAIFTQYVRQYLVPELKPGDIVILDNLSSHKSTEAAALVDACGATLLFLPPYSPDLNPIEMVFAKLKHLLRKAGERSREGLWNRIGSLLDDFPPHQCQNYFRHAGYAAV